MTHVGEGLFLFTELVEAGPDPAGSDFESAKIFVDELLEACQRQRELKSFFVTAENHFDAERFFAVDAKQKGLDDALDVLPLLLFGLCREVQNGLEVDEDLVGTVQDGADLRGTLLGLDLAWQGE